MVRLPTICVALVLAACSTPVSSVEPAMVREASWIAPNASGSALLYISDESTNDVFIYNFSTKVLVGKITGLDEPYGECVDAAGNVWIAVMKASTVVQYAHGATKPKRHLHTSGYPIGCAVNPTNGDLAVANFSSPKGTGNLEVWPGAHGPAKSYRSSDYQYLWPPAYDDTGNLFAEGQTPSGDFGLTELAQGSGNLQTITLTGAVLHDAGGVFWGKSTLGITDQNSGFIDTTMIYRVVVTGTTAKVVGRTHLLDSCDGDYTDVIDPFPVLKANGSYEVIGGNLWCLNRFDIWSYPTGGQPTSSLPKAPAEPFGESVSPAGKARA